MTRAAGLILAVGLVLAGALWFVFLSGGERGRAPGRVPDPPTSAPEIRDEERPAEVVPARPPPGSVPDAESAVSRESLAPGADGPLPGSLPLEVVEARSGRPVPGAEVWSLRRHGSWQALELDALREDALHARADAAGIARVPRPGEEGLLVLAAGGTLAGGTWVPPGAAGRARIELHPDWDVAVLVVDAAARPAPAVPLALSDSDGSSPGRRETDESGRALFRHVGLALARAPARRATLKVDLPLAEELAAELEAGHEPREPVRFELPPLGSVEVTVLEEGGQQAADGTEVRLGLVRPGEPRDISPFSHRRRPHVNRETAGARASFPHVELGCELELGASRPGSSVSTTEYASGPRRAGERVVHTLHLGSDHPVLTFRALDELGAPLVRTELALTTWWRGGWMIDENRQETTTDAEGRFRVDLSSSFSAGDARALIVSAREGALGTRVDLARPFEPGNHELGDLVLSAPPLLAAGRVVQGGGAPVAGAQVRLQVSVREDEGDERVWYWNDVDLDIESDPGGDFSARGWVSGDRLLVSAQHGGLRCEPVEAALGVSGLELVISGTGAVAGSLLLDEGVPREELHLVLRPEELSEEEAWTFVAQNRTRPEEDGSFRIEGQLPGRYDFSVELENDLRLVEIPDVVVSPGDEARDSRLQEIDLRSKLHVVRLTLVPPTAQGDLRGQVSYVPAGEAGAGGRQRSFFRNPVVLVTPHERIDATLSVQGYRSERLEGLGGEREVRLRPALQVILALPGGVVLPEPPVFLKATLGLEDGSVADWGGNAFDERHEIRCFAPGPGRMRVQWIYERRSENGGTAATLSLEPAQTIEVLDHEGEQRFELSVTPEALARALAAPPF